MLDGYHNGKGRDMPAFERMKQNPLLKPHIAAYVELMTGASVNSAVIMNRLRVNSHMHEMDRDFSSGGLDWASYRLAGEAAMEEMVVKFCTIERCWFL